MQPLLRRRQGAQMRNDSVRCSCPFRVVALHPSPLRLACVALIYGLTDLVRYSLQHEMVLDMFR